MFVYIGSHAFAMFAPKNTSTRGTLTIFYRKLLFGCLLALYGSTMVQLDYVTIFFICVCMEFQSCRNYQTQIHCQFHCKCMGKFTINEWATFEKIMHGQNCMVKLECESIAKC